MSGIKDLREKQTHKRPADVPSQKRRARRLPHELFSEKNGTRSRATDDYPEPLEATGLVLFLHDHFKQESVKTVSSTITTWHLMLPKLLSGLTSTRFSIHYTQLGIVRKAKILRA